MKQLLNTAFLTLILVNLFSACNKAPQQSSASQTTTLVLNAPDGSIRLGKDQPQVLARINQTTGLGEAQRITQIEYPKTEKGYYAIVSYAKKDGSMASMVFANFQLGLQAAQLVYKDATAINQRDGEQPASCYVYWCTDAGACSACQVKVTDPFGTPTLLCSCTTCRLHQQKEDCPKTQFENNL